MPTADYKPIMAAVTKTFSDAQAHCAGESSHLAEIHSTADENVLTFLARKTSIAAGAAVSYFLVGKDWHWHGQLW